MIIGKIALFALVTMSATATTVAARPARLQIVVSELVIKNSAADTSINVTIQRQCNRIEFTDDTPVELLWLASNSSTIVCWLGDQH